MMAFNAILLIVALPLTIFTFRWLGGKIFDDEEYGSYAVMLILVFVISIINSLLG